MSGTSSYLVAAEAALALGCRYLDPPLRVGDVRLFTAGRLHLWSRWATLGDHDRAVIARFLRWRPDALAEDGVFRRWVRQALDAGSRFRWAECAVDELDSTFELAAGKPIEQIVDELLGKLAAGRDRGAAPTVDASGELVHLRAHRFSFSIPAAELPVPGAPVRVGTTAPAEIDVDQERLLDLARELDATRTDRVPHEDVLRSLFGQLQTGNGEPAPGRATIAAGPTQLFVAPTGRGKSVLARLLAIDAASRGMPVAYIVPDIKTVLAETHRIESYLRALRLPLRVAPVNGLQTVFEKVTEALEYPPSHDPQGEWTLARLGYSCRLRAYADGEVPPHGQEPCRKLRQVIGEKRRAVRCPFDESCAKLDAFRDAATADILVVNHWAFLMGIMPVGVEVDGEATHRMSVLELVLRRAGLVLIDEIDQLQGTVIQRGTGSLALTSRGRVSPLHELYDDLARRKAAGQLPGELRLENLRRPLMLVLWLTDELAEQINRGELEWPPRDKLRWSRARDAWLARKLFGSSGEADHERLEALFAGTPLREQSDEALRQVVWRWVDGQLDEEEDNRTLRAELVERLSTWPRSLDARVSRRQATLARVVDAMILRAVLARLERAISHLRTHLPMLDEHGIDTASVVRDALLGYSSWSPSPTGPLGRRPMGFSFQRHGDEAGVLGVQTFAGDPHGFVAGLGDEVATALTGTRRVVIGMSATARFPGSPKADVQASIAFAQPDQGDGQIAVDAVLITDDADGTPVRVSGVSAQRGRQANVGRLGALLWDQVLCDHLAELASDEETRARARCLLVTDSYVAARSVAVGLADAMANPTEAKARIRWLSRKGEPGAHPPAIVPRELEQFGATGADVLVAPLSVVARGHNILAPNTTHSAISSIFVLVRPVPPAEHPDAALAHLSYDARRRAAGSQTPSDAIAAERRRAEQQLRFLQQSAGPFSHLPRELRHQVLCDVLVDIAQLAGRARRGGTDVRLYLVDAAFHDAHVGWGPLLEQSFERWKAQGTLDELVRLHGPFLGALRRFAGLGVDA